MGNQDQGVLRTLLFEGEVLFEFYARVAEAIREVDEETLIAIEPAPTVVRATQGSIVAVILVEQVIPPNSIEFVIC